MAISETRRRILEHDLKHGKLRICPNTHRVLIASPDSDDKVLCTCGHPNYALNSALQDVETRARGHLIKHLEQATQEDVEKMLEFLAHDDREREALAVGGDDD
jgi:hypothetical protein